MFSNKNAYSDNIVFTNCRWKLFFVNSSSILPFSTLATFESINNVTKEEISNSDIILLYFKRVEIKACDYFQKHVLVSEKSLLIRRTCSLMHFKNGKFNNKSYFRFRGIYFQDFHMTTVIFLFVFAQCNTLKLQRVWNFCRFFSFKRVFIFLGQKFSRKYNLPIRKFLPICCELIEKMRNSPKMIWHTYSIRA